MEAGIYKSFEHCGTRYASCGLGFPNAVSTACEFRQTQGEHSVALRGGLAPAQQLSVCPNASSLCQSCTADEECLGDEPLVSR